MRILTVLSFDVDPCTLLGEELADVAERRRIVDEAVAAATREPVRLLDPVATDVEVRHRFGNPADAILDEIGEWEPDLVVMGRRGLSAPARWLMGSVSERVIRHSHVPMLIGA